MKYYKWLFYKHDQQKIKTSLVLEKKLLIEALCYQSWFGSSLVQIMANQHQDIPKATGGL